MFVFDAFEPGRLIGVEEQVVDNALLEGWLAIYGNTGEAGAVSGGVASIMMMRAFLGIVTPRPPGNVHVGQDMLIYRGILRDEPLLASVFCADKHIRGDRRVVTFRISFLSQRTEEVVFQGTTTIFWAA